MILVDRREFLTMASSLMIGLILQAPRWAFAQNLPDVSSLMKEVGLRYREWSKENDPTVIAEALRREGGQTSEELRARLVRRIHHEYALGKSDSEELTFKYQGWIISKTEGRLCALQSFQ